MALQVAIRLLIVALFLGACSEVEHQAPFDPKSPVTKQARGEVAGRATLENEVDHSQTTIVLFNGARRYEATTDKAGDYLFQGIVPGTYQIIANARHFTERSIFVVVPIGERIEAEPMVLPSLRSVVTGNALANVLIDRTMKAEGGVLLKMRRVASIRGAASAPSLRPMAAAVSLPAVAFQTVSDDEGGWQMAEVPVGRYQLTASFNKIPPLTLDDIVVTGDGEVTVDDIVMLPLTGYFDIEGVQDGEPSSTFTTDATVTLYLAGFNASHMKIGLKTGPVCSYTATPVIYQAIYPLALTAEGTNTVCVRYVATTGEETSDLMQSINYDATPPIFSKAAFLAQNGYVDTNTAILELVAGDENSGMKSVQYATAVSALAAAPKALYQTAKVIPLVTEGAHTFWVRVGDTAGNYADPISVSVILDKTPPVLDSVVINSGGIRTNDNNFTIAAATTDASVIEVQISESSVFSGAPWVPYQAAVSYVASTVNGEKTVYVRARDPLLRVSNVVADTILFDTTPPADPSLSFAAPATSVPVAPIFLSASDNLSAWNTLEVQLSGTTLLAVNGVTTAVNAWLNASSVTSVTFSGDSEHLVSGRFRDETGNESILAVRSLVIDSVAPVVQDAAIQSTQGYVADSVAILRVSASDDRTGVAYYQMANTVTDLAVTPLEPWSDTIFVPMLPGYNERYIRAIDVAGNYSTPVSAWAIYDTTPPVLQGFTLNGGDLFARNNYLEVATVVTDSSVVEMQLSENSVFSGAPWVPYQTPVSHLVSAVNGLKTVYARVRDPLGQVSNTIARSVTLDTQAPYLTQASFAYPVTSGLSNTLVLTAADNISAAPALRFGVTGLTLTAVNGSPALIGAWLPYASSVTLTFSGSGSHTVSIAYHDEAGNVAPSISASMTVDQVGPGGQVTLLSAEGNNKRAELGWTAVAGAGYYIVEVMRGKAYGGVFTPTEPAVQVAGTGTVITGLVNFTDYTFRVRSYDSIGNPDAAYSNLMTASVGVVQRTVSWPGVTQKLIDFHMSDGILHAMLRDSKSNLVHMRSVDNGATWSRNVLASSVFHDDFGAIVATPSTVLAAYPDGGNLEFAYSSDAGHSFTTYNLPAFTHTSHSYQPGLAADGNLVVFVGAGTDTGEDVNYYVTRSGDGGATTFNWSAPLQLETGIHRSNAAMAACVSGPRVRILWRVRNGLSQQLKMGYSTDAGETWAFSTLDATANATIDKDIQCQIDARGSSYVLYRRSAGGSYSTHLWVEQTALNWEDQGSAVIPTQLPDGSTADFQNAKMWVSNTADLYVAAQDANTGTLWLLSIYLGDGDWGTASNWTMRQIDAFPTAGSRIGIVGEGRRDVRVMYDVAASSKTRLLAPYLPAPTSFRSVLTGGNDVWATWSPLQGLDRFAVLTGSSYTFNSSFNTNFDTVSYPNAGIYNAVATRDDYGTGEASNIYLNSPPYATQFNLAPPANPAKTAMHADAGDGAIYLAVAGNDEFWLARINSLGAISWSKPVTMPNAIAGLDVYASEGHVWITYCNPTDGAFVRHSGNSGAGFGAEVALSSSSMSGIRGEACAVAGDAASGIVTVVTDNNEADGHYEVFRSTDGGASFGSFDLSAFCPDGYNAMDIDVAIDMTNPDNQAIGTWDSGMGDCNLVFVTDDNWASTITEFGALGGQEAKIGVFDGMVYGLGTNAFATVFGMGSVSGSDWVVQTNIDTGGSHVAGISYGAGQFSAAYLTDSGLQLATCSDHCSTRTGWATSTVLTGAPTDLPVMVMDRWGQISYGLFGNSGTVRHWAVQGPFTDLPMP